MASLCPVRCFCGFPIQAAYTRYVALVRGGCSIKDALDRCGVPNQSPFAPPPGSTAEPGYLSPPSACCRALLMCNSDLSDQHSVLQSVVRWAEGHAAVGARPPSTPMLSTAPAPAAEPAPFRPAEAAARAAAAPHQITFAPAPDPRAAMSD